MENDEEYRTLLDKCIYLESERTYQIHILIQHVQKPVEQSSSDVSLTCISSSEEGTETNSIETVDPKKPEMPTYNGSTSWNLFIEQFEAFAELNSLPEFDWAKWLLLALNGPALEALNELCLQDRKQYWNIVQVLDRKFGFADTEKKLCRRMLKLRRQKRDETLLEFAEDVQKLANAAYYNAPPELLEYLTIQSFIDGLENTETRKALIFAEHVLMRSALMDAVKFECTSARISDASAKFQQLSTAATSNPDDK